MQRKKISQFSKKTQNSSRWNSRNRGLRRFYILRRPSTSLIQTPFGALDISTPYGMPGPDKSKTYRDVPAETEPRPPCSCRGCVARFGVLSDA